MRHIFAIHSEDETTGSVRIERRAVVVGACGQLHGEDAWRGAGVVCDTVLAAEGVVCAHLARPGGDEEVSTTGSDVEEGDPARSDLDLIQEDVVDAPREGLAVPSDVVVRAEFVCGSGARERYEEGY